MAFFEDGQKQTRPDRTGPDQRVEDVYNLGYFTYLLLMMCDAMD